MIAATLCAAFVVFSFVQERGVASAAGGYVRLQRAALEGRGPLVTIDEVMGPAVEASVRRALAWSGIVIIAGIGAAWVGAAWICTAMRGRARTRR
jgi:hypothetical protein